MKWNEAHVSCEDQKTRIMQITKIGRGKGVVFVRKGNSELYYKFMLDSYQKYFYLFCVISNNIWEILSERNADFLFKYRYI